ncbi:unnamed protein product [Meloidogyne enterolobii]|uniref:Uncharacterized protein n=1 Tax=Meloidogyne enterolobii TaxID=390850 RepID=A0ACB0Y062_MELEN
MYTINNFYFLLVFLFRSKTKIPKTHKKRRIYICVWLKSTPYFLFKKEINLA